MRFLIILLNIAFASSFTVQYEMEMMRDVLRSYKIPITVKALLSWSEAEKQNMGRMMARDKILFAVLNDRKPSRYPDYKNFEKPQNKMFMHKNLFVIDLEHGSAETYLKYANATGKLAYPYRWLIIDKKAEESAIVPAVMNGFKILPNTEVIIAHSKGNSSYDFHLIYKVLQDREWIHEYFGTWTIDKGFQMAQDWNTVTAIRRKNLRGAPLITAIVLSGNESSTELRSLKDVVTNPYYKTVFYHLIHVYDFLNITRTLKFSPSWSSQNNSLTGGMIGDLVDGDAQLAGSLVLMSEQRLKLLDFLSQPSMPSSIVFVFREPRLSYQNNLFLLPFQLSVWLSIFGFTLICIAILYITAKYELSDTERTMVSKDPTMLSASISDVTLVAIGAITQQGSLLELKGGRGRIVVFLLFFSFVFLYTSYCASIVVLLQSSSNQIHTLQELLQSKLELGAEDTTAKDPIRKAIYEKRIAPPGRKPNYLSLWDGVKKLQTEPFAFNMYAPLGYLLIRAIFQEHEKCGLREIRYLEDNKLWYSGKKNSPYREMYKLALRRMSEHGCITRWNKIFLAEKPPCIVRGGAFVSVEIIDFYPALLLLVYGMICSVIILLLEIFVHNHMKRLTTPEN